MVNTDDQKEIEAKEETPEAPVEESMEEAKEEPQVVEEETVSEEPVKVAETTEEVVEENAEETPAESSEEPKEETVEEEPADPVIEASQEGPEDAPVEVSDEVPAEEPEEDPAKTYEEPEKVESKPPKLGRPVDDNEEEEFRAPMGGMTVGDLMTKPKKDKPKLEPSPEVPMMRGAEEAEDEPEEEVEEKPIVEKPKVEANIFALRTTANREDQVMDFVASNAARKKIPVYSVIRPHGMRGYIFLEAAERTSAEEAVHGIPYARGLLPNMVEYSEIEHMLEQVKKEINMQKNDIVEIISGAFKREKAKVTRIDKAKEEVVVELLEAAVPIPITLKVDAVKVIRRPGKDEDES